MVNNWTKRVRFTTWSVVLAVLIMALYLTLTVISVRNTVLYQDIKPRWRDVITYDQIRIHIIQDDVPDGVFNNVSCPVVKKPVISREDVNVSGIFSYSHLLKPEAQVTALKKGHGRFLPALDVGQKLDIIHLYRVAAEVLESIGVRHFMVDGSLLGLNRHMGFVPWDDDIDIGVGIESWGMVKKTLSCVEGFELMIFNAFHWKFRYTHRMYPYVDIFLYKMDEEYVWALSNYTRKTFLYPTGYVFPLVESTFEGVKVPVPRNGLSLARRAYNYDSCEAYGGHTARNFSQIGVYPDGYSVHNVPCSELTYMYTMYHIE